MKWKALTRISKDTGHNYYSVKNLVNNLKIDIDYVREYGLHKDKILVSPDGEEKLKELIFSKSKKKNFWRIGRFA